MKILIVESLGVEFLLESWTDPMWPDSEIREKKPVLEIRKIKVSIF